MATGVLDLDNQLMDDPPCPYTTKGKRSAWWRGYHQRCWNPAGVRARNPYNRRGLREVFFNGWETADALIAAERAK